MADFDLSKGQTFDLSKAAPATSRFYVGMGWAAGENYDLDVSLFPCRYNAAGEPELLSPPYFIWYNNLTSPCGGFTHSPDNRDGQDTLSPTGRPTKDDEWIQMDLSKIDSQIVELSFIVTIHEAAQNRQSFQGVKDAFIRICEMDASGEPSREILKYNLNEDGGDNYAVQFGSLTKKPDGHWEFEALGAGFKTDLGTIIKQFMPGANVKG
jgi:tellurium resistance protein TerD